MLIYNCSVKFQSVTALIELNRKIRFRKFFFNMTDLVSPSNLNCVGVIVVSHQPLEKLPREDIVDEIENCRF